MQLTVPDPLEVSQSSQLFPQETFAETQLPELRTKPILHDVHVLREEQAVQLKGQSTHWVPLKTLLVGHDRQVDVAVESQVKQP